MSLPKGKIRIHKENLAKLFNLPEGVEIMAVKCNVSDDIMEFIIMSAEEIDMLTYSDYSSRVMRSRSVPLGVEDKALEKEIGYWAEHTGKLAILHDIPHYVTKEDTEKLIEASEKAKFEAKKIAEALISKNKESQRHIIGKANWDMVVKQDEKDVKNIFNDIVKNVKKNGGNI